MKEIERKFIADHTVLSKDPSLKKLKEERVEQGYLFNLLGHVIRVRVSCSGATLTYKGPQKGISRTELELEIPKPVGAFLLRIPRKTIRKTRTYYMSKIDYSIWEVDDFLDIPLCLVEVELERETSPLAMVAGLERDVSTDLNYSNVNLLRRVQ